ncbi:MAG: hypothetical protein JST22_12915 [Bacteroidetes bacterium]|nr:hypothetical protein [Bacteroidota bacterium]
MRLTDPTGMQAPPVDADGDEEDEIDRIENESEGILNNTTNRSIPINTRTNIGMPGETPFPEAEPTPVIPANPVPPEPSTETEENWPETSAMGRLIRSIMSPHSSGLEDEPGIPPEDLAEGTALWELSPTLRGQMIEDQLAQTDYKTIDGWFRIGAENNGWFPLIDFQNEGEVVSVKTVDTRGFGWMERMEDHIRDLDDREITVNGEPVALKRLDIRVEPGGYEAAKPLVEYGKEHNVAVTVREYR